MHIYIDLAMALNFIVDLLIILGTNRLMGYPKSIIRSTISAGIGAIYAGFCLLPCFRFFGKPLWKIIALAVMVSVAFGWNRSTLRRGVIFSFISMALGGIAMVIGRGGVGSIVLSAIVTFAMCALGFGNKISGKEYVPVELHFRNKMFRLTALKDTGNALKEPITGENVLVVGPEIAWQLLGINNKQLLDPIATFERIKDPRMRLIPYRTVGNSTGVLLAMRLDEVRIGGVISGQVVAFSPNDFGAGCGFEALTGGIT